MSVQAKIKVAIIGASGYSGEELLRLLVRHPGCEITAITSRQHDGKPVGEVFPRFAESTLRFTAPSAAAVAEAADAAFLALPHGLAAEFAVPLLQAGLKVIDISADFRLRDTSQYKKYYKEDHPAPELLSQAIYGLPERYRDAIRGASLIACPGCYPTSSILPSAPLLARGLVSPEGIVIFSASGVSGAGRKIELPYIFPECNESFRAYNPVSHRHVPEIEQEIAAAAGLRALSLNFIPHLAPFNRGIHSTLVFNAMPGADETAIANAYAETYGQEPFVRILPKGKLADTKNVTFSNMAEIGFAHDGRTGKVIVTSAIDNLTKGASGQAIQCLNILYGLEETTGLL